MMRRLLFWRHRDRALAQTEDASSATVATGGQPTQGHSEKRRVQFAPDTDGRAWRTRCTVGSAHATNATQHRMQSHAPPDAKCAPTSSSAAVQTAHGGATGAHSPRRTSATAPTNRRPMLHAWRRGESGDARDKEPQAPAAPETSRACSPVARGEGKQDGDTGAAHGRGATVPVQDCDTRHERSTSTQHDRDDGASDTPSEGSVGGDSVGSGDDTDTDTSDDTDTDTDTSDDAARAAQRVCAMLDMVMATPLGYGSYGSVISVRAKHGQDVGPAADGSRASCAPAAFLPTEARAIPVVPARNQRYALKIQHARMTEPWTSFLREVDALVRSRGHPHIVQIESAGVLGDRGWILMEYGGVSLSGFSAMFAAYGRPSAAAATATHTGAARAPAPPSDTTAARAARAGSTGVHEQGGEEEVEQEHEDEAAIAQARARWRMGRTMVAQMLAALAYLHDHLGMAHRDIKPHNIVVAAPPHADGQPTFKLCDFGLAKALGPGYHTGGICSMAYRAPEVLLGSCVYGAAVDVWALGITALDFVTNTVHLHGRCEEHILAAIEALLGVSIVSPAPPHADGFAASPHASRDAQARPSCAQRLHDILVRDGAAVDADVGVGAPVQVSSEAADAGGRAHGRGDPADADADAHGRSAPHAMQRAAPLHDTALPVALLPLRDTTHPSATGSLRWALERMLAISPHARPSAAHLLCSMSSGTAPPELGHADSAAVGPHVGAPDASDHRGDAHGPGDAWRWPPPPPACGYGSDGVATVLCTRAMLRVQSGCSYPPPLAATMKLVGAKRYHRTLLRAADLCDRLGCFAYTLAGAEHLLRVHLFRRLLGMAPSPRKPRSARSQQRKRQRFASPDARRVAACAPLVHDIEHAERGAPSGCRPALDGGGGGADVNAARAAAADVCHVEKQHGAATEPGAQDLRADDDDDDDDGYGYGGVAHERGRHDGCGEHAAALDAGVWRRCVCALWLFGTHSDSYMPADFAYVCRLARIIQPADARAMQRGGHRYRRQHMGAVARIMHRMNVLMHCVWRDAGCRVVIGHNPCFPWGTTPPSVGWPQVVERILRDA